jgi:hypothetical protein
MNFTKTITSILSSVSNCIHSKEYARHHSIQNAFTRFRKLSFSDVMLYVINSSHHSISVNYARFRSILNTENLPMVSKQALSKARQGISHEAFLNLFRISVEEYYKYNKNTALWNGFHLYAVDGSTIQIPVSEENLKSFGSNPNKYEKDTPLASISALYDITNDILVDVHLKPYRFNERDSAKLHMDYLPDFPNSIVIFDRGYPSEDLFRFLQRKRVFFLMRVPKTLKKVIHNETDLLFTYPAKKDNDEITLRSIHFTLENGNEEYLVTNLMPEQLAESHFKVLYALRWGIESKYRELKNRLEIENFNSLKPTCIKQEFYVAMFLSNVAAILKQEADKKISPNALLNYKKHTYQTNRSFILNRTKSMILTLLKSEMDIVIQTIYRLTEEAAMVRSIVRPNRKYGRYRKHTRRKFYSHMKNCL